MAEATELDLRMTGAGNGSDDGKGGESRGGEKGKRQPGARTSSGSRKGTGGRPSKSRLEAEIESRLDRVFDQLAEQREARGDEELATALREDKRPISSALVSLTRPIGQARQLVLLVLAVIEPLLAFGRIGRILAGRVRGRQERRAEERQRAEYEAAVAAGMSPEEYAAQAGQPPPA